MITIFMAYVRQNTREASFLTLMIERMDYMICDDVFSGEMSDAMVKSENVFNATRLAGQRSNADNSTIRIVSSAYRLYKQ